QGNYEAESAELNTLREQTTEQIDQLTQERDGLAERLESTSVQLAATSANLADEKQALQKETAAHNKLRQATEQEISRLTAELVTQHEAKLKTLFDESKKKTEEMSHRITSLAHELEAARGELAEKAQQLEAASAAMQNQQKQATASQVQGQQALQTANARLA